VRIRAIARHCQPALFGHRSEMPTRLPSQQW